MKRVAIYSRVSTDDQTTENQERELRAVAKRQGWQVVKVYTDHGVSGAKVRVKRGLGRLAAKLRDQSLYSDSSVDSPHQGLPR